MPRLLACDLDGTLLDEAGLIRPAVRSAIHSIKAAGVHVVLSTGRSPWAVTDIARQLGLRGPQIVMNGGAFVSPVTGEVGWARRLDRELVIEGLEFARGLGASPLLGFLDGHARQRVRHGSSGTQPAAGAKGADGTPDFALGPRLRHVDSLESLAGDGPIRVYIPTSPRDHAAAVAEAVNRFSGGASIVYSDQFGFEIMAPCTNKGEALRRVAGALGLGREQVAAMGDGPNDREMLAFAGVSAALEPVDGSPTVLESILAEATRVVSSSAHNGALEAIRFFFPDVDLEPIRPRPMRTGSTPLVRAGAARPPDWDDDPEPDLGLTAA
jgi:Cof subfamily protein (haloacid dehalogenase superfamily)